MLKVNIECMLLESWIIPRPNDSPLFGLYVADATSSCLVQSFSPEVQTLQPGDIIRLISAQVQLYSGKLTLKHNIGSKIERIGTTALVFTEDPCISYFTWTTSTNEPLTTTKGAINFSKTTDIKVNTKQSREGLRVTSIPPSLRLLQTAPQPLSFTQPLPQNLY